MEKKIKIKYRKINTLTEFDKRRLDKENQKYEQQIKESKKYFGKKRLLKVDSLRNIIPPFEQENRTLPKKSKNSSMLFFPKRKLHFDLSKPVYSNTKKNILTLKTNNNILNKDNVLNPNILSEMKKRSELLNKKEIQTFMRNIGNNSGKLILNRQKNRSGFDRHVIISKSCLNFAVETKYTSDAKIVRTSMAEEQKNQNINFNKNNRFKERHSILSTLEYSNIGKVKKKNFNKYKYSRENILNNFVENDNNNFKTRDRNYFKYKKKYHFVNNDFKKEINIIELENNIKKINRSSLAVLLKENKKIFSNSKSIIECIKFEPKYRDPLNNSFDRELKEERIKKEKNLIKLNILSGVNIIKDINEELQKRKVVKNVISGRPFMLILKRLIIRKMVYLKHIQISLEEILKNYKISNIAFAYPQTEYLIMAIRNKDFDECCNILDRFKHIVLDHDYFFSTPLHWAAKSNFYEIIPKLIAYGASVNEKNLLGNTPLHLSASQNYFETSIFLLLYLASPFIKNKENKKPFDLTNDVQINIISKKIKELHLKNCFGRQKYFYENIQKDFSNFIIFEFSNIINPIALNLIKDLKNYYL